MGAPLKVCLGCLRELPASSTFFHAHPLGKGGLNPRCRDCRNASTRARYRVDIVRTRAEKRDVALRSYYRHHEANKAKAQAAQAQRRTDPNERANHARISRAYYAANKQRVAAVTQAYREANAERVSAWKRNYEARAKGAEGTHSASDIRAQLAKQLGLCFWCAEPLSKFHVDHVVPLSKGGTNWPDNIVCACARCNLQKGSKMPQQFRSQK